MELYRGGDYVQGNTNQGSKHIVVTCEAVGIWNNLDAIAEGLKGHTTSDKDLPPLCSQLFYDATYLQTSITPVLFCSNQNTMKWCLWKQKGLG